MTLAAVHIPPGYTIPPAILLAAAVVWYWIRLGRRQVPASRRRIRRVSLALILVSVPVFVTALSVIDPNVRVNAYVLVWSVALLCLLLIIITAVADALNNFRLLRELRQEELLTAALTLVRGAQQQREAQQRERQAEVAGGTEHNGHHGRIEKDGGGSEAHRA